MFEISRWKKFAEGAESQDDNIAKSERDEASEAQSDVVPRTKTAKFLRCATQL